MAVLFFFPFDDQEAFLTTTSYTGVRALYLPYAMIIESCLLQDRLVEELSSGYQWLTFFLMSQTKENISSLIWFFPEAHI